ncbi:MAG: hypothetical protein RJA72_522, partial [Pseudomonadota bacterium]
LKQGLKPFCCEAKQAFSLYQWYELFGKLLSG